MMNKTNKVVVVQLTHRRRYDIAAHLAESGRLHCLVTDFYDTGSWFSRFEFIKRKSNSAIPSHQVRSSTVTGLIFLPLTKVLGRFNSVAYIVGALLLAVTNVFFLVRTRHQYSTIYCFDVNALFVFALGRILGKQLILEQCIASRRAQKKMYSILGSALSRHFVVERANIWLLGLMERAEARMSSIVVVPSEYVAESLQGYVDKDCIKLVKYKINWELEPDEQHFLLDNRLLSIKERGLRMLFVGNGNERKGYLDIIQIARDFEDVKFVFAGNLTALPEALPPNVLIKGKLGFSALREEFCKAHYFIFPSYLEGSALAAIEATAFGLPSITTLESGTYIQHGREGFVVKSGDKKALANCVSSVLDIAESEYSRLVRNCFAAASRNRQDKGLNYIFDLNEKA